MITYEFIQDYYKKYGYEIISPKDDFKRYDTELICMDIHGYKYSTSYKKFKQSSNIMPFSTYNPYTIENIRVYMGKNNNASELISTNYNDIRKPLEWECGECGDIYEKSLFDMMNSKYKKCRTCSFAEKGEDMTDKKFIEIFKKDGYTLLSEYVNSSSHVDLIDKDGYKYRTTWNTYKKSRENISKFNVSNPFTIHNIKQYIKINKLPIILLSTKYIKGNEKLTWVDKCGHVFKRSHSNVLFKNQFLCSKCSQRKVAESQKIDKKYIVDEFKKQGYTVKSDFDTVKDVMQFKDEYGYLYNTTWTWVNLRNKAFMRFGEYNKFTVYNIKNYIKLNELNIDLLNDDCDIKNIVTCKLICKCKEHNEIFETEWRNIRDLNVGCDKCTRDRSSLEIKLKLYLEENNYKYKEQQTFDELRSESGRLLRFDFALLDSVGNIDKIIECDGLQHYYPVDHFGGYDTYAKCVKHDTKKNNYCKEMKIELIRIPYWFFEDDTFKELI